jgi:DNA-binding MarR family transcriptional regulator
MRRIESLFKAVSYIRENINPDFALPQLAIFLRVAQTEGITQTELSEQLSMPQGSMSRNIKQLSKYYDEIGGEKVMAGYDLVRVEPDLVERRRLAVYLTEKGKKVINALQSIVEED